MIDRGKFNVLGVQIDAVDYEAALERIIAAAKLRRPLAASALAVHGVMTGVLDSLHRFRLNQLDLVVPDGQPVRWALRWLYSVPLPDRVYGPKLMLLVCQRAAREGLPIFLFGGTQALLTTLAGNLHARFPDLIIAGMRPSKFRRLSPLERDENIAAIRASGAMITFVGLGCPRQEVFAYEFREALCMPLLAVGAAFNFHAGLLPQAPAFLQRHGLEWCYRLFKEPRRLWKRYCLLNPYYLYLLLLQRMRWRAFDPADVRQPQEEVLCG